MPKSNAVSFGSYYKLPNPNLKAYFGRIVKGQPYIYETPFARGESTDHMLRSWKAILKSIDGSWPTLWEYENDLANKVGPMSVELPLSKRIKDIDHYYEDILLSSKPIPRSAVAAVTREWNQARGLVMRSRARTVELMKKSSNSGSPYFTKRRNVVIESFGNVYPDGDEVVQDLESGRWLACATLGWRGQEGGPSKEDVKQRVIWMFPLTVNIEELRVYQPVIEAAQRFNIVPSWVSMDEVDRRVTDMFDTKSDNDLIVCTDFSKFDQHFNPVMQDCAREILRGLLAHSDDAEKWLNEVFPIKYMIPLAYNWGEVRRGNHGMGSGSGGTNADETLVHRALQYESALNAGARLNPNSQCLGDDGILTYPGITVEDVIRSYSAHGLEMNSDKQYASRQDCTYLRRWHHRDYRVGGICVGVYSTCRALGRLRYLERYMDPEVWSPKAVALRQLSILENVKWHPMREQFVEFCMKRDKYRLGIDIPDFLADIESEAKEVTDLMPEFLGYTKTLQSGTDVTGGIKNWWIVQYLRNFK